MCRYPVQPTNSQGSGQQPHLATGRCHQQLQGGLQKPHLAAGHHHYLPQSVPRGETDHQQGRFGLRPHQNSCSYSCWQLQSGAGQLGAGQQGAGQLGAGQQGAGQQGAGQQGACQQGASQRFAAAQQHIAENDSLAADATRHGRMQQQQLGLQSAVSSQQPDAATLPSGMDHTGVQGMMQHDSGAVEQLATDTVGNSFAAAAQPYANVSTRRPRQTHEQQDVFRSVAAQMRGSVSSAEPGRGDASVGPVIKPAASIAGCMPKLDKQLSARSNDDLTAKEVAMMWGVKLRKYVGRGN